MHHGTCLNMKKLRSLSLAAAFALVGCGLTAQAGIVEVLSPDGQSLATYDTVADALANVPAEGTVRLLANESVTCDPTIARSCQLDLNGFTLGQKFFNFSSDVRLNIDGRGGKIDGRESLFRLEENCTVNITNVAITGYNLVYAPREGSTVNVYADAKIATSLLVSQWGNETSRVHVWQGASVAVDKIDDSDNRADPRYQFHQGVLSKLIVPAERVDGKLVMAATKGMAYYDEITYYFKVVGDEEYETFAAAADFAVDGVPAESLATATAGCPNGSTLQVRRDCTVPLNENGTAVNHRFPVSSARANTFDLCGHTLTTPSDFMTVFGSLTLTNGTIRMPGWGAKTVMFLQGTAIEVRMDRSVTFRGDPGHSDAPLAFVFHMNNSRLLVDGTSFINMRIASHWNDTTVASSEYVFTNDVVFAGDAGEIGYQGSKFSTMKIYGGEWSVDPSYYLGTGCGIYRTNTVETLPYFVTPLAQQTYDLSRPVTKRLFTVGSPADAGSPLTVNLKGPNAFDLYELADYSALTGYGALQFVFARDAACRKFLPIYENGVLSAARSGLSVIVR